MDIVYHRFSENLGGTSLIKQWTRCVELINNEEFFCLFSDDDIMSPDCVNCFYETLIGEAKNYDVYHFDIEIVDIEGKVTKKSNNYPILLSASRFFSDLYTNQIDARMPEFIFRTHHFWEQGGFVEFDLGFTSDNATVMVCAKEKGIYTLPKGKILWRDSGINISSSLDFSLMKRKNLSLIHFLNWTNTFFIQIKEPYPLSLKRKVKIVSRDLKRLYPTIGIKDLCNKLRLLQELSNTSLVNYYFEFRFVWSLLKKKR